MLAAAEEIAAGKLPGSLDELARLGAGLCRIGAKVRQTLAVIVAEARRSHFGREDKIGWIDWCTRELGLDSNNRSHLNQVGTMLLEVRELKPAVYARLFSLDIDKLLALSAVARIRSAAGVIALASYHDLAAMTRAEVRLAVLSHLGDPRALAAPGKSVTCDTPAAKIEQPSLPGFDEIWAAAEKLSEEDFITRVKSGEDAGRSMQLGIGFLSGALEFNRSAEHRDPVALLALKSVLLDQIAAIDNVLAGAPEN